ncbi:MAG: hypothetical protein ACI9DC_001497 [Gammaproteobacteria bacterium]|jgi:hypothetical protein
MSSAITHSKPMSKHSADYLPGPIASALLAASPLLALLVFAPANIYLGNQAEFEFQHVVILHLCLLHLAAVMGFYLLFQVLPSLRKPFSYPLAVVGVLLFVIYLFAPAPTAARLHAGIYFVKQSTDWALFEVGVLLALWAVVKFCPAPKLVDVASLLCLLVGVAVPVAVIYENAQTDASVADWAQASRASPATAKDAPNVYHLIFDAFDGHLLAGIIDGFQLESSLAGFVWYPNARSNYATTRRSFPSFMTGRLYNNAVLDETGEKLARTEGLVKTFAAMDYKVTQYNAHHINNHLLSHERHSNRSIESRIYGRLRHMVQLLDLSALVLAPQLLKSFTHFDGRGVFSHWLLRTQFASADWTRNPPLLSLMLLDQMLADEPGRPARGQYVNAHFLVPHAPESLNAKCQYAPTMRRVREHLIEQTVCTVTKIREIADTLRKLNRFRNAMIVIHSDHGNLQLLRPLLLVKYPGAESEPFRIDRQQVQLIDIAPSILEAIGVEHEDLDGESIRR